jgi:hypothetical protein
LPGDVLSVGYSDIALPAKLGIKANSTLLVLNAPDLPGLAPLPRGVTVHRRAGAGPYDVALLFCPDRAAMARRFGPAATVLTAAGALWACWPKKASGVATDLTDTAVRDYGLQLGLVDVKVAAIDSTWSGLKFVRRVADRTS